MYGKRTSVLLCPWDRSDESIKATLDTVKSQNLYGVMHTTWHTLSEGMRFLYNTALSSWKADDDAIWSSDGYVQAQLAAAVRKVAPFADYNSAGWAEAQIVPGNG